MNQISPRLHFVVAVVLLLFAKTVWAASERYTIFVSDLHVGAGRTAQGNWRNIEDFRWQPEFDKFLAYVDQQGKGKTDLIFVGDTFELWQSPLMSCSGDLSNPGCVVPDCHDDDTEIGCSEPEALARIEYPLKQHPDFIASVGKFATSGDNRAYFLPGNHDAALLFDKVRKTLLDQFPNSRVDASTDGYWLSADGAIYSDHGHQGDDVNKYKSWPNPFVLKNGVMYLQKPWGENMVQQFYNQYEELFPVVDNLSGEKAGLEYAIRQAGLASSATAVGKFFRFFVFQQSLKQGAIALGPNGGPIKWDYDAVQAKPIEFFLPALNDDPVLHAKAQQALSDQRLVFDPKALTPAEIDALCGAKQVSSKKGAKCPAKGGGTLGAGAKTLLIDERKLLAAYLEDTLPKVRRPGQGTASIYIYGHTHKAVLPTSLALARMPGGVKEIQFANTGAFQRVASGEQLDAILRNLNGTTQKSAFDLQPENLPACYTFVTISPYVDKPSVSVNTWSKSDSGDFVAATGTCLTQ